MIVGTCSQAVLAGAVALAFFGLPGIDAQTAPEARQVLAPTGKLRVGVYVGSPSSMVKNSKTGETVGLSYELGKEFARRLNVPFQAVEFPRMAEVLEALKRGEVDFTTTNSTPARAADMDFSPVILDVELGYLVPSGSPVTSLSGVDKPGIRIGVMQGSSSQGVLGRQFKDAKVVAAQSIDSAIEMLSTHKIDAYATNKAALYEMSDQLPNSKVLEGRWGFEHFAIAIPKGRDRGKETVRAFAEEAKAQGLVKRAAERAGLRGIATPE